MNQNIIICIIAAAVFLLIGVAIRAKRQEKRYDERQLLARSSAFRTSFFVLLSYCFLCGFLGLLDITWTSTEIQMFFGALISISVFACVSIAKDAYFYYQTQSKVWFAGVLYFVAAANIFAAVQSFANGTPLFENGQLSALVINLITPVSFIAIGTTTLIKGITDKKLSKDE